nr:ORF18B [Acipenserid herpesvirus 1]
MNTAKTTIDAAANTAADAAADGHFSNIVIFKRTFKNFNCDTLFEENPPATLEENAANIIIKGLLNTKDFFEPESKYKTKTIIKGRVYKKKRSHNHETIKSALKEAFWLKLCKNHNVIDVVNISIPFYNKPYESRWYERNGVQLTKYTPNLPHILKGVLSALAYIHDSVKLYHRNIQASSVAVVNGEAKLRNFKEASQFPWTYCNATLTTQAPELLSCKTKLPAKVDIWSFGMMVWKLYGPTCFNKCHNPDAKVHSDYWFKFKVKKQIKKFFKTNHAFSRRHPEINSLLAKTLQINPLERSTISELQQLNYFVSK